MRVLIAVGGFLAVTSTALAADMPYGPPPAPPQVYSPPPYYAPPPPPLPFSWTGFYLGFNGGVGVGDGTASGSISGGLLSGSSGTGSLGSGNLIGGIAGGQIGANYQTGGFVLGVEADMQWSGQTNTGTSSCGVGCTLNETVAVPWFATVRFRSGAAIDRIFFYGTGGLAVSGFTDNVSATGLTTVNLANLSSTSFGWTVGTGIEAALNYNVSIKVEYLFMQTNISASGPLAAVGGTVTETGTLNDNILRAGLNYRFPVGPGSPY